MTSDQVSVAALRDLLREVADRLALEAESITSPSPNAIVATALDGSLLRLDVSRYPASELSL